MGTGALAPGAALPPMRALAADLGVNPNTVAAAYRVLRERGVIETAGRRGSRVRSAPATTPRREIRIEAPEGVREVSQGNPDVRLLPPLRDALLAAADRQAREPTLYGAQPVRPELARQARAQLDADGVPDGPIAVTSGSLDAIERVLSAHLRPGDPVAVEDPGWGALLDLVPAMGLRALPVPVDDEGPVPAGMAGALEQGARAVVVTARAQNPTGAAVSAERARHLRAVLADHPRVLLVEDDHGHGMVDLPLHALVGTVAHWALVRSTAKAYGPDLRLATLTGDPLTVDRVRGRQQLGPGWISHLLQDTVAELWASGAVDPARVAGAYRERRDGLVRALRRRSVEARGRSGMNVWVPVADETGAVARLLQHGWAVAPGARFRLASPPGVRITVSTLTAEEIEPLAETVAEAVRPSRVPRRD